MRGTYIRLAGYIVLVLSGHNVFLNSNATSEIEAASCENGSSDICGQRSSRTACASAQSDLRATLSTEQFLAICELVASLTLGCPQGQEPVDRCINMACYKSLGRLFHETLLLATGNSSTNQAALKLFGPTLLQCQHNASTYNGLDMPSHQTADNDHWERYIFIISAPIAFLLGVGIIILCLWVRWLRRHNRLCFAEKEEPCTGKWEGASERVTMQILQKHFPTNLPKSESQESCIVETEAFVEQSTDGADHRESDSSKIDVETTTVANELQHAAVGDSKTVDAAEETSTLDDNVVALSNDKNTQGCAEQGILFQATRLTKDDDSKMKRWDDKQEERSEVSFRFSNMYEVSRDSVASEHACFSLTNDNYGKTDDSTEQTIE